MHIAEDTRIVFAQPIVTGDSSRAIFLAVTSVKRADGTLAAYDVRRFPKPVNPATGRSTDATTRP